MLIHAYGLFWRADEMHWPGSGVRSGYELLGRVNKRPPALQVADSRKQHGIYVLYNDWGSYYAGLALTGVSTSVRLCLPPSGSVGRGLPLRRTPCQGAVRGPTRRRPS